MTTKAITKKIVIALIALVILLYGGTTSAALLTPNTPGGLLSPFDLSGLIVSVASPFKVNGTATSTITGDGTESTIGGGLAVTGGIRGKVLVLNASTTYTLNTTDFYLGVASATPQRVLTLPSATSSPGRIYVIKDQSGAANTTNILVQVTLATGQMINNATNTLITANFGSLSLISDGANWYNW